MTLLKVMQVEFYQELTRQFRIVHAQMFDSMNVRSGVQDFFDNVLPQKVSAKASRLLNSSLELNKVDIHPINHEALLTGPPKTANQLMKTLQRYRIEKDFEIRDILALIAKAQGAQQQQLQIHLIMKTLLDLQIIEQRYAQETELEIIVDGAAIREVCLQLSPFLLLSLSHCLLLVSSVSFCLLLFHFLSLLQSVSFNAIKCLPLLLQGVSFITVRRLLSSPLLLQSVSSPSSLQSGSFITTKCLLYRNHVSPLLLRSLTFTATKRLL